MLALYISAFFVLFVVLGWITWNLRKVRIRSSALQMLDGIGDNWFDEATGRAEPSAFAGFVRWYRGLGPYAQEIVLQRLKDFMTGGGELAFRSTLLMSTMGLQEFPQMLLLLACSLHLKYNSRGSRVLQEAARIVAGDPSIQSNTASMAALGMIYRTASGDQRLNLVGFVTGIADSSRGTDMLRLLADDNPEVRTLAGSWFARLADRLHTSRTIEASQLDLVRQALAIVETQRPYNVTLYRKLRQLEALPVVTSRVGTTV